MGVRFKKPGDVSPGVGSVTVQDKQGNVLKDEQEQVSEFLETEPVIYVGFSKSATVNVGNYESMKVNVSLQFPTSDSLLDETFERINGWVSGKLANEVEQIPTVKTKVFDPSDIPHQESQTGVEVPAGGKIVPDIHAQHINTANEGSSNIPDAGEPDTDSGIEYKSLDSLFGG